MEFEEYENRGLLIDKNGKIYDQDLNEYRNENGGVEYLEVSIKKKRSIYKAQPVDVNDYFEGETL